MMKVAKSRKTTRSGSKKSSLQTGRLAELYFLSQEPLLIELMWKIAAMSRGSKSRLKVFFDKVGETERLNVSIEAGKSILFHAIRQEATERGKPRIASSQQPNRPRRT